MVLPIFFPNNVKKRDTCIILLFFGIFPILYNNYVTINIAWKYSYYYDKEYIII